jgi:hypothetical protein
MHVIAPESYMWLSRHVVRHSCKFPTGSITWSNHMHFAIMERSTCSVGNGSTDLWNGLPVEILHCPAQAFLSAGIVTKPARPDASAPTCAAFRTCV